MSIRFCKVLLASALLLATGCQSQKQKIQGYDLQKPVKIDLPKEVDQISGISYNNDNSVFAVDDDNTTLYKIPLKDKPAIEQWKFNKGSDCEDVVAMNNNFFVLTSAGTLLRFALPVNETAEHKIGLPGKNEFEALYYESSANQLILICKECSEDKKSATSAYAFNISSNSFSAKPAFVINRKDIEAKLGKEVERFKPSGAAINPVTKELFIVSSVNKLLVVLHANRTVKAVEELNPKVFKQPEGITFTPTGDLLISNEGSSKTPANILVFKKR
jgi:uncharacterized protein YjiK